MFFQGFSLALSIEINFSNFSFCFTFSVSMELGEVITFCSLEGVSFGESKRIQSVCAQWLGGRAVSEVSMRNISQGSWHVSRW